MKSKKIISLLCALSLTVSAFAGLATSASAAPGDKIADILNENFDGYDSKVLVDGTAANAATAYIPGGETAPSDNTNGLAVITTNRGSGDAGWYKDTESNLIKTGSYYEIEEKDSTDKYLHMSWPFFGDYLGNAARWAHVDFTNDGGAMTYTADTEQSYAVEFDARFITGTIAGNNDLSTMTAEEKAIADPVLRLGTFATGNVKAVEISKDALNLGDGWVHIKAVISDKGAQVYVNNAEQAAIVDTNVKAVTGFGLYTGTSGFNSPPRDANKADGATDGETTLTPDTLRKTPAVDIDNLKIYTEEPEVLVEIPVKYVDSNNAPIDGKNNATIVGSVGKKAVVPDTYKAAFATEASRAEGKYYTYDNTSTDVINNVAASGNEITLKFTETTMPTVTFKAVYGDSETEIGTLGTVQGVPGEKIAIDPEDQPSEYIKGTDNKWYQKNDGLKGGRNNANDAYNISATIGETNSSANVMYKPAYDVVSFLEAEDSDNAKFNEIYAEDNIEVIGYEGTGTYSANYPQICASGGHWIQSKTSGNYPMGFETEPVTKDGKYEISIRLYNSNGRTTHVFKKPAEGDMVEIGTQSDKGLLVATFTANLAEGDSIWVGKTADDGSKIIEDIDYIVIKDTALDARPAAAVTIDYTGKPDRKVQLTSDVDWTEEAELIHVSYNTSGVVTSVKASKVEIASGSTPTEVAVPENETVFENDKFFVWDSLKGMNPLAAVPYVVTSAKADQAALEAITGTVTVSPAAAKVGTALTASVNGLNAGKEAKYQWQIADAEDGIYADINGAISATYTPVANDLGKYLRVVVTADGTDGDITKKVGVVAEESVTPKFAVTITQPIGGTLTVMNGSTPVNTGDEVDEGTVLTVTAIPDAHYTLGAVTANGEPVVGNTVTVSAATTIAATFTEDAKYTVTITQPTGGTITVTDNGTPVETGAQVYTGTDLTVNVVVTDASANEIKSITVGENASFQNGGTFSIAADTTITAVIGAREIPAQDYALTVAEIEAAAATAGCAVAVKKTADNFAVTSEAEVTEGTGLTVLVTEGTGYKLKSLKYQAAGGEAVDITSTKTFSMPSAATTVTAEFVETYTLTIGTVENGTITVKKGNTPLETGATIVAGDVLTITAAGTGDYTLDTLTVNGEAFTSGETHTVAGDVTVAATVKKITYKLTVGTVENGTVTVRVGEGEAATVPATGIDVEKGATVTVIATPDKGYELATLKANTTNIKDAGSFAMSDTTIISATFSAKAPVLSYDYEEGEAGKFAGLSRVTSEIVDGNYTIHAYDSTKDNNEGAEVTPFGTFNTTKVMSFTASHNAANGYAKANLNFGSAVENATSIRVEFDSFVESGTGVKPSTAAAGDSNGGAARSHFQFYDGSVRLDSTGTAKGNNTEGVLFKMGHEGSNGYRINGSTNVTAAGKWVHSELEFDYATGKTTYKITDLENDNEVLAQGSVDFMNKGSAKYVTGMEFYSTQNWNRAAVDNVKVYVDGTSAAQDVTIKYVDAADGTTEIKTAKTVSVTSGTKFIVNPAEKNTFEDTVSDVKYRYTYTDTGSTTEIASVSDTDNTITLKFTKEAYTTVKFVAKLEDEAKSGVLLVIKGKPTDTTVADVDQTLTTDTNGEATISLLPGSYKYSMVATADYVEIAETTFEVSSTPVNVALTANTAVPATVKVYYTTDGVQANAIATADVTFDTDKFADDVVTIPATFKATQLVETAEGSKKYNVYKYSSGFPTGNVTLVSGENAIVLTCTSEGVYDVYEDFSGYSATDDAKAWSTFNKDAANAKYIVDAETGNVYPSIDTAGGNQGGRQVRNLFHTLVPGGSIPLTSKKVTVEYDFNNTGTRTAPASGEVSFSEGNDRNNILTIGQKGHNGATWQMSYYTGGDVSKGGNYGVNSNGDGATNHVGISDTYMFDKFNTWYHIKVVFMDGKASITVSDGTDTATKSDIVISGSEITAMRFANGKVNGGTNAYVTMQTCIDNLTVKVEDAE